MRDTAEFEGHVENPWLKTFRKMSDEAMLENRMAHHDWSLLSSMFPSSV